LTDHDPSCSDDRGTPPTIPGFEQILPAVIVSAPPGWTGTVKAYNWPLSEAVDNRNLVWINRCGDMLATDDITPAEAQAAIELLLGYAGAIE